VVESATYNGPYYTLQGCADDDGFGCIDGEAVDGDCVGACAGDVSGDCTGDCGGDVLGDCTGWCTGETEGDCTGFCGPVDTDGTDDGDDDEVDGGNHAGGGDDLEYGAEVLTVSALPATGAGNTNQTDEAWVILASSMLLLAGAGLALRRKLVA